MKIFFLDFFFFDVDVYSNYVIYDYYLTDSSTKSSRILALASAIRYKNNLGEFFYD